MSTFDDQSSVTNPNNGQTVASISKQVKDRTDELFTAAESDINQAVTDAAQSATDAQDAADSIGRYQGLWPDTGGSADKGDTYQTQVSGTPTGQYFTALQNTTVDPVSDDVNWRGIVSVDSFSRYTNIVYKASGGNSSVENMIAGIPVPANVGNLVIAGKSEYLIKTPQQATIDGDVVLESCNITLDSGLVAILHHNGTVTSDDIRFNTTDAVKNLEQLNNAILEGFNGASKFIVTSDVEIDSEAGASCIVEFDSILRPFEIDTGSNWIKFKNQLRGGNHTGGRFSVGTDRVIGNLNLDGQVYSVTEAQTLSNIPDSSNPVYSDGIQRGFYHKTEDDLIVNGTLRVKGFRHFGFDITGDSTPTKSFNIKINNLEIEDCFGYNYIMAALVRYDSVQINNLKCIATASAWGDRPDTGTPTLSDISGFDIEPAKTNGSTMSALNIASVEVQGCIINGFSDESFNHAQRVNISNIAGRNPTSVNSGYGVSMVGTEANISNVNLSPGGKFEIEEKSTTDSINNTRTVNFSNVHIEQNGYSGNLLVDADFSSLSSWVERGSQINELTEDGEFGKFRLHMQNDAAGSTVGRRQDVPCVAGEAYVYGVHAQSFGTNNSGNPSTVAVSVSFYDSGDTLLAIKSIRLVDLGLGIKGKTIGTATAPSNSSYVRFNISAEGAASANADAYIDAAFLYRGFGYDRFTPSLKKSQSLQIDWNVDNLAVGSSDTVVRTYYGARSGQVLTVTPKTTSVGVIFYGYVTNDDEVTLVATNISSGVIDLSQDEYHMLLN